MQQSACMKNLWFPVKERGQQRSCKQQQNKVSKAREVQGQVPQNCHAEATLQSSRPEAAAPSLAVPRTCILLGLFKENKPDLNIRKMYIKIQIYGFPSKFGRFGVSGWRSLLATTDCDRGDLQPPASLDCHQATAFLYTCHLSCPGPTPNLSPAAFR